MNEEKLLSETLEGAKKAPPSHGKRAGARGLIWDALSWCLLAALLSLGFGTANEIGKYTTLSLRFDTEIDGKTAYAARQYSIAHSGENVFWPTFWREDSMSFETELASVQADYIAFSGDANLVYSAAYLYGGSPGVTDGAGCAVSSELAFKLWGGADVVGKTLSAGGEDRIVRGVFKGNEALALVPYADEDSSQSWSAAELYGGVKYSTREDAKSYASAAGLGKSPRVIAGGGTSFVAGFLAILPLIVLGVYFLALVIKLLKKRSSVFRGLIIFALLLALALEMSSILGLLPSWLIPTRWSDFTFWSDLIGKIGDGLSEYLSSGAGLRDLAVRGLLLKQTGLALFAVGLAISVCFRWSQRSR